MGEIRIDCLKNNMYKFDFSHFHQTLVLTQEIMQKSIRLVNVWPVKSFFVTVVPHKKHLMMGKSIELLLS